MEIIAHIWNNYLYIPLFNLLIYIYLNWANFNLGVAVIMLTIALRIVLIPFTYFVERGKVIGAQLLEEVNQANRDFGRDPVKRKLAIRQILRKRRIHPWAKAIVLGSQLLVLVLLYQVFVDGIRGHKFHLLYSWVTRPDFVDTHFIWFDIGQRNLLLAGTVAIYLFLEFLFTNWHHNREMNKQEQMYGILFPAFSFLVLAVLPSVKSLFILTSLLFSTIISLITTLIENNLKQINEAKKKRAAAEAEEAARQQ